MSDETALSMLPVPGASMPATTRRPTPRRNAKAKPKRTKPRLRNAGAPAPRPTAPRSKATSAPPSQTKKDSLVDLLQTLGGAAATSVVGAYAVKWGIHPELVSTGLGLAGGYFAWQSQEDLTRHLGTGAASAAGSQIVLRMLNPTPSAPKIAAQPPPPQPTQTAQLPRPKNADLGALPPGMLDAAFERARAELAVAGDGYPPGYEYEHHRFHHGPVMP